MQNNAFQHQSVAAHQRSESLLTTHKVLRNTYFLLSMTLLFSAAMAAISTATDLTFPRGFMGLIITLAGMYGLMFLTMKLRNSIWGIPSVFAFTGFMGLLLGPLLNVYLSRYANGGQLIMMAVGTTGLIFFALSGYVLTSRKDFSFLGGFIFAGMITALILMVAGFFFHSSILQLTISGVFVLLSSGMILYHTSAIIHGGERNYIMATVSLYIALFNLFVSLLQILGAFSGNRN